MTRPTMGPPLRHLLTTIVGVALGLALVLNAGFARLDFRRKAFEQDERAWRAAQRAQDERLRTDISPLWWRAAALNYREVLADIAWVQAVVHFGEQRALAQRAQYLVTLAELVRRADPSFAKIYLWFPSVYVESHNPATHEELTLANDFIDLGIALFPGRFELPFAAAMNYVGYSGNRKPEERLREVERAIAYLKRASELRGKQSELVPFVLSYFYDRRRELRAQLSGEPAVAQELSAEEIDYFVRAYLMVRQPDTRRRIEELLQQRGVDSERVLAVANAYTERLSREHGDLYGFLPLDLWSLVYAR